jgi:hypothetical protein
MKESKYLLKPPADVDLGINGPGKVMDMAPTGGLQLIQRGGMPILKRAEGTEILSEGMHLSGFYVLVRAFYDSNSLRIIVYDPLRSQSDSILFKQDILMTIFGGRLDQWFSKARSNDTALKFVSWLKLRDVDVVNHIIVEHDSRGFMDADRIRNPNPKSMILEKESPVVKEEVQKALDEERKSILKYRAQGKASYAAISSTILHPNEVHVKRPRLSHAFYDEGEEGTEKESNEIKNDGHNSTDPQDTSTGVKKTEAGSQETNSKEEVEEKTTKILENEQTKVEEVTNTSIDESTELNEGPIGNEPINNSNDLLGNDIAPSEEDNVKGEIEESTPGENNIE